MHPEANRLFRLLLFAPLIFICHFLEESPTFVLWFNEHVSRGITSGLFWRVNITALVITLVVVALEWFSRSGLSAVLAIAWLSFLMFANSLFHMAGAMVDRQYVPGLITAVVLYLPYYAFFIRAVLKTRQIGVVTMLVVSVLSSVPMLIHGYLILFRGSRLF
jgi:hypothetical protein